jgi:hypothetical protein
MVNDVLRVEQATRARAAWVTGLHHVLSPGRVHQRAQATGHRDGAAPCENAS